MTAVDVVETMLPGVGVRYELRTSSGQLLGIVMRRDGAADIGVYDRQDPDQARDVIQLDSREVDAVAEILGAPRLTQRFADLSREVPGLQSARITVERGSVYDGQPLGATRARTRTGCSIVALVRGVDVITSPGPEEVLRGSDVLVVIGARSGLERLDALLYGRS